MNKAFSEMSYNKQCLIVGKVVDKYDQGKTIDEISTIINEPVDVVLHVVESILTAREFRGEVAK